MADVLEKAYLIGFVMGVLTLAIMIFIELFTKNVVIAVLAWVILAPFSIFYISSKVSKLKEREGDGSR